MTTSYKRDYETNDKLERSQNLIDLSKQPSAQYQFTNSVSKRKILDLQTFAEEESKKNQLIEWNPEEKIKLDKILLNIQKMKNEKRAHDLVMNLPSRMLKSFNLTKFELLNDKSYHYDERYYLDQFDNKDNNNEDIVNKFQEQLSIIGSKNSNCVKKKKIRKYKILYLDYKSLAKMNLKQCGRALCILFDYIPVIQPSSYFKLGWDLINLFIVLICMFYLPIIIAFDFDYSDVIPEELLFILPNILLLDCLINMNTGYFEKGQVITKRSKVIRTYVRKHLLKDLITLLPFLVTLYGKNTKSVHLSTGNYTHQSEKQDQQISEMFLKCLLVPFFLKAFQLNKILKKFEERFNLSRGQTNIIQLAKLLYTIILINHLFACVWIGVAKIQDRLNYKETWMTYLHFDKQDWLCQYLAAYYFTTVTMITVGYGDILPVNELERIISLITMMLSCGVFGYSLNEIGVIFSSFFEVDNQIKQKISLIQRFMSKKNINQNLQYQIREYLEYYWREQSEQNQEQEQSIIEQLSGSLRSKLLFEANKIVLKDSPIFKHNFSKNVIEQTVPLIKEIKYPPESLICLKGVFDDSAIYFIENGSVEIIMDYKLKKQQPLFQLSKGDSFGAYSFFTGLPRSNNVRSKEFTTILMIKRQDFLQLISQYNEDFEMFCNIRDSINFLNDYTKIGIKCKSCNSHHHLVNECQYIHYVPNKAKIIKFHNDEINIHQTQRQIHIRRKNSLEYNFKNSRSIMLEVNKQLQVFQEHYDSMINMSDEDNTVFSAGFFGESEINVFNKSSDDEVIRSGILANNNKKIPVSKFGLEYSSNFPAASKSYLADQNKDDFESDSQSNKYDLSNSINRDSIVKLSSQTKQVYRKSLTELESTDLKNPKKLIKKKTKENQYVESRQRSNTARSDKQSEDDDKQSGKQENNDMISSKLFFDNRKRSTTLEDQMKIQQIERIIKAKDKVTKSPSLKGMSQFRSFNDDTFLIQDKQHSAMSNIAIDNLIADQQQDRKIQRIFTNEQMISKMISHQFGSKSNIRVEDPMNFQELILKQLQLLFLNQQTYQQQDNTMRDTKQIQNELTDIDQYFDKMKSFVKYNPRFNFPSVISRYNQFIDAKKKKNIQKKRNDRILRLKTNQTKTIFKIQEQINNSKKLFPHLLPGQVPDNELSSSKNNIVSNSKYTYDMESLNTLKFNKIIDSFQESKNNYSETPSNQRIFNFSSQNNIMMNSPYNAREPFKSFQGNKENLKNIKPNENLRFNFLEVSYQDKEDFPEIDDLSPSIYVMPNNFDKRESNTYFTPQNIL